MFTEDLDQFLDENEFSVEVTSSVLDFQAIYDNEAYLAQYDDGVVSTSQPKLTCKTVDAERLSQGDTVTVTGIAYKVKDINHDGTGITTLELYK